MRDWGEAAGGAMDGTTGRYQPGWLPRSLIGQLLVASPTLQDPNFERAVVYVLSHDRTGAFGVVLNRATEARIAEVLVSGWDTVAATPDVVFEGGPVDPDAAVCLARAQPGVYIPALERVDAIIGTLDITVEPEEVINGTQIAAIRVFRGYAGWAPGQLANELAAGAWLVLNSLPSDAFTEAPDDLWQQVLRRQGGLLAAAAHYPSDPSLN